MYPTIPLAISETVIPATATRCRGAFTCAAGSIGWPFASHTESCAGDAASSASRVRSGTAPGASADAARARGRRGVVPGAVRARRPGEPTCAGEPDGAGARSPRRPIRVRRSRTRSYGNAFGWRSWRTRSEPATDGGSVSRAKKPTRTSTARSSRKKVSAVPRQSALALTDPKSPALPDDKEISALGTELAKLIDAARQQVVTAANATLTTLYWQAGHRVCTMDSMIVARRGAASLLLRPADLARQLRRAKSRVYDQVSPDA
jgi:hypothetical protein